MGSRGGQGSNGVPMLERVSSMKCTAEKKGEVAPTNKESHEDLTMAMERTQQILLGERKGDE